MVVRNRIYVDRSRSETYQRCKRLRWLEYHSGSAHHGLSPVRKSIHLVLGGAVHAGLEVLLRQAQEYLTSRRQMEIDDTSTLDCLFKEDHDGRPLIRQIEDDAVLAALDDLRAAMTHGVELDDQEKLAVQQPQQSIATYSSTTSGTFQGKPNAEAAIEITFDGWDIGADTLKAAEQANAAPQSLEDQLKASLGQDWTNVKVPVDTPTLDDSPFAIEIGSIAINTSEASAKAMADQALGVDDYLREELAAQVEAMVRAYARRRLRPLLEQFEVLEVEREGEWKLGEEPHCIHSEEGEAPDGFFGQRCHRCGFVATCDADFSAPCYEIWFMSRLDALLLERQTGYLYLQSYKTTGAWDRRREADAQVDMQGLSEAVDVEKRLLEAWLHIHAGHAPVVEGYDILKTVNERTRDWIMTLPEAPRVLGVRYEYLLKGPRRQDKKDLTSAGFPRYVADTPLIRAYKQDGITADDRRWATSYDWYELTGKSRRLDYRSWQKAPVWKFMPIADWIDLLDKGEVQPDCYDESGNAIDILAEQFVPPIHVYRNERDMEDWREQLEAQEIQIAMDVAAVQAVEHDPVLLRSELNKRFPQTRKASSYPGKCPFYDACYGPPNIRENLEETGLFQIRVANHPQENQTGEAPMP